MALARRILFVIGWFYQKEQKLIIINNKKKLVILLTLFFHTLGILVAFFERKNQLPFHLLFHSLRFFTWWSVHTSLLTIFALVTLFWEEKTRKTSWLSQFILLSAALFSLVTFLFCFVQLLCGVLEWKKSLFLNFNALTWHFIAPPLTLLCFYSWGKINLLKKNSARSIIGSWIWPSFYFAYVYLLSCLNNPSSLIKSGFNLYLKKYPYQIFQFLAKKPVLLWLVWLPVAFLIIYALFWLLLWTKMVVEKGSFNIN